MASLPSKALVVLANTTDRDSMGLQSLCWCCANAAFAYELHTNAFARAQKVVWPRMNTAVQQHPVEGSLG